MNNLGTLQSAETQQKLTAIIEKSFESRPMPSGRITGTEVSRRVFIAKDCFLTLLNDCGWSEPRILDHMPIFLARALDGEDPIPDWAKEKAGNSGSVMWGSEAAGRVEPDRRMSALVAAGEEPRIIIPGGNHGS